LYDDDDDDGDDDDGDDDDGDDDDVLLLLNTVDDDGDVDGDISALTTVELSEGGAELVIVLILLVADDVGSADCINDGVDVVDIVGSTEY
jgi:hypothetical protein